MVLWIIWPLSASLRTLNLLVVPASNTSTSWTGSLLAAQHNPLMDVFDYSLLNTNSESKSMCYNPQGAGSSSTVHFPSEWTFAISPPGHLFEPAFCWWPFWGGFLWASFGACSRRSDTGCSLKALFTSFTDLISLVAYYKTSVSSCTVLISLNWWG